MVGCPAPDVFNALLADVLDAETRASLADHAGACEDCHRLVASLLVPPDPERIGRYEIERRIGAGAMGVVYAARDPELARRIAIKVLHGGASEERLRREAQALAQLNHPNVVAVHDVGEHAGRTFVAMALVDGENLRSWLSREHPQREIVRVLLAAADGLVAAHAAGMIHRDFKPDNVFVGKDGAVQVGDFGLARSDGELPPETAPLAGLTQTGMVLGTPAYMAPEHAAGEPTPASDQFSFAVTAWEALSGQRPFAARTYGELRDKIEARQLAPLPDGRRLPSRLRAVLERALSADPTDRWPSMAALRDALAPPPRRWPWIAGGAGVIAAAAAAALVVRSSDHCTETTHELDAVWTPAAQHALAGEPLVTGYAHDWLALRHDACRADDELRTRCLGRARDALAALVAGATPDADPTLVHRGVLALPVLADCKSPLVGSASPQQVRDGEALLAKIATTDVRVTMAGNAMQPEVDALSAQADALGYEPAIIEIALTAASGLARSGQPDQAAERLRHAMTVAEASHDDLRVSRVAAELADLLVRSHELDEARTMIELATGALQRAGGDPGVALRITQVRAELASASGDHSGAIALAESSLAPLEARTGSDSEELGEAYGMLAREYELAQRPADAQRAMARAEHIVLVRTKHDPAGNVVSLYSRINNALIAGDPALAVALSRQMLALAHEMNDPAIEVEAQQSLAQSYEFASDGRHMVDEYQALLDLLAKLPDAPLDTRGTAYEGLGRGYLNLDDPDHAIEALRKAIADATARGPAGTLDRNMASIALGEALLAARKPHDARDVLEPVVHALAEDPDVIVQRRASAEIALARALWDDGGEHDRDRARALASDAARDFQAAIAKAKAPGGMIVVVRRLEPKLAAVTAWQAKHP